mgnify:CR=1 FL=1
MFESLVDNKFFKILTQNSVVDYLKKNWKVVVCVAISIIIALMVVGYFRRYKIEYYEEQKPVMKMFYAKWCGHSRTALAEFNKCESDQVDFEPIDCDAEENKEELKGYNIEGYPTFYIVNGNTKTEYKGGRTKEEFEEAANKSVNSSEKK